MGLLDILNQYTGQATGSDTDVGNHFDQVAGQADKRAVGDGVAAAMRSDATPSFGQTISHMFGQSDPQQKAGLINQLLQAIGPPALSGVAGGALGRMLGGQARSAAPAVTPEQASQLSPTEVDTIASHAHQ